MPPKQRKIAIMGFRSVGCLMVAFTVKYAGKSSLAIQFVNGEFVDYYDPTIENTFTKNVKIQGQDYLISIVDTRGQEEHSMFPIAYAMDIHGYCFVYSIDNKKSFEVVKVIYEKLIDTTGPVTIPIILVGNKLDLQQERLITYEQGKELAQQMKAQFVEVSAKKNSSVTDLFHTLILCIENADKRNDKPHKNNSTCTVS
ncbi:GTP-binding protein Rheb-like protein [Leptotrombidium deliense]|uniref:GTP-binding protein Rheb-like protein n=1 Tax=Leptotrombidium deliense TaxID=299467 RepID=A0A443SHR7_9ACAR|nr:GTP-binding protein Rheb-like protein [Leptotrombidium deliense]